MRLNDALVSSFSYAGTEYDIDLAFDNVLDVFDVLGDESLRDYEKIEICLALLLGEQSYDRAEAFELWNYIYDNFLMLENDRVVEYDRQGNPLPIQEENKSTMDYAKDAKYIYASFRQAYGINLVEEQGKLHWHEFQALLNSLPDDTIMQRIIQIRVWEPRKGETAEYKQSMRKLQKIYALDDESDAGSMEDIAP